METKNKYEIVIHIPNTSLLGNFVTQFNGCASILSYMIFIVLFAIFNIPILYVVIIYLFWYMFIAYRVYSAKQRAKQKIVIDGY